MCNESVHGLLRLLAAAVWSSELFAEIAKKNCFSEGETKFFGLSTEDHKMLG